MPGDTVVLIVDVEVWSPATLSKLKAKKTPLPLTKLVFSMLPLQFMVSYVEYFSGCISFTFLNPAQRNQLVLRPAKGVVGKAQSDKVVVKTS